MNKKVAELENLEWDDADLERRRIRNRRKENWQPKTGERVARFTDEPTEVRYFLNDHLGSTVATIDRNGTVQNWYQYKPFGEICQRNVVDDNRYQYTGQESDEELSHTLDYYGARYYDPGLRLFLSVDPAKRKYSEWGPYVYVVDNPLKYTDPHGDTLVLAGNPNSVAGFLDACASALGGFYDMTVDAEGIVSVMSTGLQGPMMGGQQAFHSTLMGAVDHSGFVLLNVTYRDEQTLGGNFQSGTVDIADLNKIGDGRWMSTASILGHEIAEQTAKQARGLGLRNAHDVGLAAEASISGNTSARQGGLLERTADGKSYSGNLYFYYDSESSNWSVHWRVHRLNIIDVEER